MSETTIAILLADDHHMVRESLAGMLQTSDEIEVVGQASNGMDVMDFLEQQAVDVIVLDYSMPGMDGLATLEAVRRQYPSIKVVILTMHEHVEYAIRCLEAGASGYMLKSDAVLKLIDAVKAVVNGEVFVSDVIQQALAGALHKRTAKQQGGLDSLSPREFEMLRLLAKGLRVSDCAREMGVSESSASTYRRRIMQKLNLNTLGELVRWAVEQGISE